MKKSKIINLLIVSSILTSCTQVPDYVDTADQSKVYMRSDSTAPYTRSHLYRSSGGSGFMMHYFAFRAIRDINNSRNYNRYSSGISRNSNVGRNSSKTSTWDNNYTKTRSGGWSPSNSSSSSHYSSSRGGFGSSSHHSSGRS